MTASAEKTHFFLRKLHSLTGLAICGFILEHFFTNSASIHALDIPLVASGSFEKASEVFNSHVAFLHSIPALPVIEIATLLMPFAFHIFYGFYIVSTGKSNLPDYANIRNFCYVAQRISAAVIFAFLIIHVAELRFGCNWISGESQVAVSTNDAVDHNYYLHVTKYFMNLSVAGWILYIAGIAATAFHFGNGIFLAGITWGLWTRRCAQDMAFKACMLLSAVIGGAGFLTLLGFYKSIESIV